MTLPAGLVLDPYDDRFASLRRFFHTVPAPDFIKRATVLTTQQLSQLPDHAFAGVLIDGERRLRKYASVDPAHAAVNVLYFIDASPQLPPPARVKIAANLIRVCSHYGLRPPQQLGKVAELARRRLVKTDGNPVLMPARDPRKALNEPLSKTAGSHVIEDPYIRLDEPFRAEHRMEKIAAVFDDGRWPLRGHTEVLQAAERYHAEHSGMHPRVRHQMCVKIAGAADQLGVTVPPSLREYQSDSYSEPMLKLGAEIRQQVWAQADASGRGPDLLKLLMQKRANGLSPHRFAEDLALIDTATGVDHLWGRAITDPWLTTFGGQVKHAEWQWAENGSTLTETELRQLLEQGQERLRAVFGAELANGLQENPTVVFDSLPTDTKLALARLAHA